MKTKLLLLITFLVVINSYAQIGFQDHIITDNSEITNQPDSIFTDLDNDGDLDVLLSSSGKISWYENLDGNGLFGRQQIISTDFDGFIEFDANDLDNDGDIDVVATSYNNNKIAWFENLDGLGNFSDSQIIDNVNQPVEISACDIDGDGDIDILAGIGSNPDRVSWYENLDGQGNFGDENVIGLEPTNIHELFSADLDSDGDLDVFLVSANNDTIVWFENLDGQGDFGTMQIIAYASGPRYISAIDYDADGDLDILSYSMLQNRIGWYENLNGQGSFGSMSVLFWNTGNISSLTTFDIDGDGDLDLFTEENNQGELISWYENLDGQGDLGPQQIINQESDSSPTSMNINFGDIDNDGDGDLLWTFDNIHWFENLNGLGSFGEKQTINSYFYNLNSIYSSDIDGDGDLDILLSSIGYIAWFENIEGYGFFITKAIIDSNNYIKSVYPVDIDGDGDIDVISASPFDGEISWFKNIDGQGNFDSQIIITTNADGANSVFAIDIDGDGDIDVLSASSDDDKIAWYENLDGQGNFSSELIITTIANGATSVYATDIDGDGDMDVISASAIDNKIAWYKNLDGQGNFGTQLVINDLAINASDVYAADIDGDGDMDVISASKGSDKVVWYENLDGQGNFSTQLVISDNSIEVESIYVEDIDGDGDMDVISTSSTNSIAWYENLDGLGNFNVEQIVSSEINGMKSVYASDLDSDGDIDILSVSILNDKVVWHENLGFLDNHIVGNVNFDINNNGCNGNNLGIPNVMVTTDNGSNSFTTFTSNNGAYILDTNEGEFTTTITTELPNYFTLNPAFHTSNFIGLGNTDIADFCIEPIGDVNDLNIALYPLGDARPGFDVTYQLVYRNVGTTLLSGDVSISFDDTKMTFLIASETITSQTSNSLSFDYSDLMPFETRTIDLLFNVFEPPITESGDVLTFTSIVNPILDDYTEDDNIFILDQTVINSYDPNDIQVLEGEEIYLNEADDYLHYIIRFQNVGTASAINVRVENELDANLDWNTLQIENISHSNRVEITDGNQVEFIFDNINLPDSTTNEEESHGFIQYKIKPKNTVDIGDSMSNNANIYFDFNPPVVTNTVTTTVVEDLSINDYNINEIKIYPNPTQGVLNIVTNGSVIEKISIINIQGIVLKSATYKNEIDVSSLATGIYFIQLSVEGKAVTKKFIKN